MTSNSELHMENVAAIVVTFHPDSSLLDRLLSFLNADGIFTIVVDNGGGRAALADRARQRNFCLIELTENQGLGTAINMGIAEARKAGASYVITFDQDSSPEPGMVQTLYCEFESQAKRGVRVGAVGPLIYDQRRNPPLVLPFIRLGVFGNGHQYCTGTSDRINVDTLITSGCLTSLEVLDSVGTMNTGFFVDYTDYEWCFRAKSKGFVLFGVCAARMVHELGDGHARRSLGLNLLQYSPIRRYYYARNTITVACLGYVSVRWKVHLIGGLILRCLTLPLAPRAGSSLLWLECRMQFRGILDGLRGVRGPLTCASGRAK
jgi:rhamnosyltransferase